MLPVSYILHPLPVICTKTFSQENITKIQHMAVNLEEAANLRVLWNSNPPLDKLDYEVQNLLFVGPGETQLIPIP